MRKKPEKAKPTLDNAERHKRFVEMAKRVGASEDIADFDKAFEKITSSALSRRIRPDQKT